VKYIISISIILLSSLNFLIQGQTSQFQVFSVEEGLPQSQVYAILMDHNNSVWVGTKGGGVSVFDGAKFRVFNHKDGLTDDKIFSLFQDNDKLIWIGTGKGLYTYNGLEFTKVELEPSRNFVVSSITQDKENRIWVATNVGLYFRENNKWISYSEKYKVLQIDVSCLFLDGNGTIWAGNDDGLFELQENGYQHTSHKNGLTSNKVRCIKEVNGHLLVGTYGGGLNARINGVWYVLGSDKEIINDVFVDNKDQVWLATHNNGVVRIKTSSNQIDYLNTSDGLSTNHTRVIKQDNWGNIWIGTSGGGLNRMFTPVFEHFNKSNGFKGNMFYALAKSSDGGVWTSTNNNGFTKVWDDSIRVYDGENGFRDVKCKALFEDSQQVLWIGTEGSGVFAHYNNQFFQINGDDGLADNWIREITQDQQGNIWIATVSGVSKITYDTTFNNFNITIKDFSNHNGLPDDRINCIKVDKDNKVWFGCQSGHIGYFLDDNIFATESDRKLIKSPVKSIDFDMQGRIWLATEGNGVFYGDLNDQFVSYRNIGVEEGLNNGNVYLIKVDGQGHVWAGAGSGVDEIALSDANEILFVKHFSKNEGFLGGETCSNAATIDFQGRVWLGTLDGLNRYSSSTSFKNKIAPIIYLEDISIFYESILNTELKKEIKPWFEIDKTLQLSHTQNHLSFHFNANNLINPDKVQFQYQLVGFDNDWSPINSRKEATYSNLPSGSYVFKVKGVNEDGFWSEELSVSIEVDTPYWMTFWFAALVLSVGIGLMLLFVLLIFRRYRRRNKEEKERLKVERNMLELEQKTLRLQMNPHFIFNAMNTVQALIAKNDTKQARYYLAKFSKLMRKILDNSRHSFISLQDEIDALESYLNLEKLSGDVPFEYEFKVDEKITTDVYGIPPLILQPFTENSIVHGLKEIDHEGKITISFELFDDYIECKVIDNGRGRAIASEVRHQKSSYHKSTALLLTQERLAMLNTEHNYKSFEVIDLKAPTGTEVIVRIPKIEIY